MNSGRPNDVYSRTEDIDTVYIQSTMQRHDGTANVTHRLTEYSPKTIQHNLHTQKNGEALSEFEVKKGNTGINQLKIPEFG